MHGTKHSNDEILDGHPNCRCAEVPFTKTWEELGAKDVPETRAEVEPGESLFARLTEEQQRAILGNAGYEAYKAGAVKLSDFVGRKSDPRWGTMRYARSLKEILGAEEARKWRTAPQPTQTPSIPVGAPVSSAFDLSRSPGEKSKVGAAVRRAMAAADKVHGIPPGITQVPVEQSSGAGRTGSYEHAGGRPVRIKVSSKGAHQEVSFLHESGHLIDHQLLGAPGRWASETAIALDEWRQAVGNSRAVKSLLALLSSPPQSGVYVDRRWLRYALQGRELFARSYAQYIAERTGDAQLLGQVSAMRLANPTYSGVQWEAADFAPIAQALDKLFTVRGWMK